MEAFHSNTPATCSNISPLKEQADGAVLLFDPSSPEEIAETLWRLWNDEPLRQRLMALGKERLKPFTWDHAARLFRALYRKLGNQPLNEEDRALLAAPPLA
jgi:glycosyltransferase involved in cell wall biosynthesis